MHRLASCPGIDPPEDVVLVEQPPADVLVLSSAATDLSCLEAVLLAAPEWNNRIRALHLDNLGHPAQLDHYLSTTAEQARVIVVRLLGSRGHWSYGLEQLQRWSVEHTDRQLLVLAGTVDQQRDLHGIGSVAPELADRLAALLREGGQTNMARLLEAIQAVLDGTPPEIEQIEVEPLPDPFPWDWQDDVGATVGVVLYRAQLQAGDNALAKQLNLALRKRGLRPRLIWVSSLRDPAVQAGVLDLLRSQGAQVVITGTAFASVSSEQAGLGSPLWDRLDRPVLQLLTAGSSRERWQQSSRGLEPLDLSLQVVMPELDARVTTRPCAFRQPRPPMGGLATAITAQQPDQDGIDWLVEHAKGWIDLQKTPPSKRRVAMVLANYPVKDGRVANGVGLDTPASVVNIIDWLSEAGYQLGDLPRPDNGDQLIASLLQGRTNSAEGKQRRPLDHLPLATYQVWWDTIPIEARSLIASRWGEPEHACDLDGDHGFAIHGLRYGNLVVLLQPDRGYDPDQIADLHSPDLPPPHRYLAQYLWLREVLGSQVMVHVGKHGSAEWLPGKGVGLSAACGPHLALGALPHLYPFIVNDPGEGSQAKRRGHAVVLDHLTPPLGRAGLHGDLQRLESLLDELVEARQLGGERTAVLEAKVLKTLQDLDWPGVPSRQELKRNPELVNSCLDQAETYLCELKESQIRTGLHRYGQCPDDGATTELLMALARPPLQGQPGLTQLLASEAGLAFDPWTQEDGELLTPGDQVRLGALGCQRCRRVGDGCAWLEQQALLLIRQLLLNEHSDDLVTPFQALVQRSDALKKRCQELWQRLKDCGNAEREGLLRGLDGRRITAGPSGAPSRGRPDVLPTGRNFYSVDLRGLPTEAAWDLGRRSAERLLDLHLQEEGEPRGIWPYPCGEPPRCATVERTLLSCWH